MNDISASTPLTAASIGYQTSIPRGLKAPGKDASDDEIKDVATQMEGVFFSMFVKEMRKTMTDGSLFGEGPGADTYEGFFDQMMGEHLGQAGGLGIAEMVVKNAMLNRERVSMDDVTPSLITPKDEGTTDIKSVGEERETNERANTKAPNRG
ncbi:MAG: Rod binding domain-containing protein [Planctomycetota bacterium]|jgi:Rod binding domain-containing protein